MANKVNVDLDMNVQGYVDGISQATQSTAEYETETRKVADATVNLNKELRKAKQEAQNLAAGYAQLSEEAKNSAFGQEMARQLNEAKQKAAEYIDLQGDLNTELRNMASDTAVFDTLADGLSGLGSTLSAVTGTIGIFTDDTEMMTKAVTMFTTAESIASAAIKVKNLLQKQSSLMLGITAMQQKAAAMATNLDTAAKSNNIIVTNAATAAQAAFNAVAKANPYVLLATAIVAVGVALYSFISSTNDATDAQEEQNKKLEEAKRAQEEYQKTLRNTANNTIVPLYSSFLKLQSAWKSLNSEAEKQKFIKDYASEMQKLGVEIHNVRDAENLFIDNEKAFVESIKLRAQAAVLMKQLEKQLENISLTNDVVDDSENTAPSGRYTIGETVANETAKQLAQVEAEIDKIMSKFRSGSSNNNTTKEVKNEIQTYKEAISEYDKLVKERDELNKQMQEGRVDSSVADAFKKEIDGYDTEIQKIVDKWHIKAKVEVEKPQISDLDKIKNEIENALNPKVEKSAKYDFSSLPEEFNKVADETIEAIKRIETARNNLTDIMNDKESTDAEISSAQQGLDQLNTAYDELLSKADVYQELSDAAEKATKKNEQLAETVSSIGNAVSATSELFSALGEASEDNDVKAVGIVAKAIATVSLSFAQALTTCKTWVDWLAFGISGMATMVSMINQINSLNKNAGSYANGGIVGGHSYTGDKLMAFVNSNEAILNTKQQKRVVDAIDNNKINAITTNRVEVVGKISGTDILLVSKNTNKVLRKTGRNINI